MKYKNEKKVTEQKENEYSSLKQGFKSYSKIITISLNLVVTIILGVIVGYYLDRWLETKYWIVICIFLFAGIAMFNFFREILKVK